MKECRLTHILFEGEKSHSVVLEKNLADVMLLKERSELKKKKNRHVDGYYPKGPMVLPANFVSLRDVIQNCMCGKFAVRINSPSFKTEFRDPV